MSENSIEIVNPKSLGVSQISAQRIAIGISGDYKPCIAKLPDGELLVVFFNMNSQKDQYAAWNSKVQLTCEDIFMCRSSDGGKTWSQRQELDLLGREPYFTILSDGTILITVHVLPQDVDNEWAPATQTLVHRSTDGGRTWKSTRFEIEKIPGWERGMHSCSTRNVLELADGSLAIGVSGSKYISCFYRSDDKGATWQLAETNRFEHYESIVDKASHIRLIWGESYLSQAPNGDLLAINRVDPSDVPAIAGQQEADGSWDHHDRMVLYRSTDNGNSWSFSELGSTYGEMYPAIIKLQDGRLLLTFTVRDLHPPLGVRAVLGEQTPDGFKFDFQNDRIMIDVKTPEAFPSGGGFGRTVQLDDGTLVTSYSYNKQGDPGTGPIPSHWAPADQDQHLTCEIVCWRLP